MNTMVDRPKAAIAGAVITVAVLFLLGVGFVAGRASGDDDDPPTSGSGVDGEELAAGPTAMNGGVPVGFAHSPEGARSAALAWFPWLFSTPVGERPAGIGDVLASGLEPPLADASERFASVRTQFAPIAVRVDMESEDRATVTLLGPMLRGQLGDELGGEFLSLPVTLEWDDQAGDWRITILPTGSLEQYDVGEQVDAADVEGFEAVRPVGAVEGSAIVEEVPGE